MTELESLDLQTEFSRVIFKPLLKLCDRNDLEAVLRLHSYIESFDDELLNKLDRTVLGKVTSWFSDKEVDMMKYLREFGAEDTIPNSIGIEIGKHGEEYCSAVETVLGLVLNAFKSDTVRYEMVKESYRHVTYQLMYELNKCSNKAYAISFANRCFPYCDSDDKRRIKNTFGEVNIKEIDWNEPHTEWDVKGDNYYYGRGCERDYTQALYWYHKASDAGNMHSPNSIGVCYREGNGVPKSDEQAVDWFRIACNRGNPDGAFNLAECYFAGLGVIKSIDEALGYWAKAAKLGHPSAQLRRDEVFSTVRTKRKAHRAKNHVCHDLGFQMTIGPALVVEITLNRAANVYLVNSQGYQNYLDGNDFSHYGGYASESPYLIGIPSSNHWYVIIDNGDDQIDGIISNAKVKNL